MDPQLRARLTWTALLVLIALSGAGLAVAADRPYNPQQRPELTYRADHEAMPLMQSLADDLSAVDMLTADLSESGREALGKLQALDVDEMRAAVADGDAVSDDIASSAEEVLRARRELLERVDPARLGPETAAAFALLADASQSVEPLTETWAGLSADAERVASLLDALEEHDATVFRATTAGRQSRWEDALRLLDDAAVPINEAVAIRNQLAASGDVGTLDDLLARYQAYDAALRALYEFMNDGGQQSGPRFRELQGAVEDAQSALPADTSALSVIVADAGSAPLTRQLVDIESTRGDIGAAIAAVNELSGESR